MSDKSVWIVVLDSAGFWGSVHNVVPEIALNCARQLRSGSRKVRIFTDEAKYLEAKRKDYTERIEQKRLSML